LSSLLLDTHVLLWSLGDVGRLSPAAQEAIVSGGVPVHVSSASIWEIAIKRRSGKLKAPANLVAQIAEARFEELPISHQHADLAGALPLHHRDPFDRMIVAQARCEGMTIISCDERIAAYGVAMLW
jgi:PIN domain nuclease of toxin-antitoxin system